MLKNNLGYPRIGNQRELKRACEKFWGGKISKEELLQTAATIRQQNWSLQKKNGIDLIPSNDFSFYDQVLDMILLTGAIPERYQPLHNQQDEYQLDLYFAMARGYQQDGLDLPAMEMTKWFDTNYHYIVPEFKESQNFQAKPGKAIREFSEAKALGITTKPVLIGPLSFLLLGKEKEADFNRLDLLDKLLPVYAEILKKLAETGAEWVQLDEPFLSLDLNDNAKEAFYRAYQYLKQEVPQLKILLATYFEGLGENIPLALKLPVCALHLDLLRNPDQLEEVLQNIPDKLSLSLGVIDGRNIWRTDYQQALQKIEAATNKIGKNRIMIAPSCSLLHVPCDLELEGKSSSLPEEIKPWLSFARQKLEEVNALHQIAVKGENHLLEENQSLIRKRQNSPFIHKQEVKKRLEELEARDAVRHSPFKQRQQLQHQRFSLPLFPTTTIGSFPQTKEVRQWRARFKKEEVSEKEYLRQLKEFTRDCIKKQEEIGLDVLVHGEFERNDMVEYFGEKLDGFAFTQNGWVQSYGSRCVKPPVIFGDVLRPEPMTVFWSQYAQSLTELPMKGMLTGPVTILQWSFVRDDQPRKDTCLQIALSIRDEVVDLEKAGIGIIQVDEPAIREGLPLRKSKQQDYLNWAVFAFQVATSGVQDKTQIHTHMCYSEFNDIMEDIARMDADVITIETSRSQMELLQAFESFRYPNEIGPGVYDIHSPRVPSTEEIEDLLEKAAQYVPARNLWVNPDCGLKTRSWEETEKALKNMVNAARKMRAAEKSPV